MRPARRGPRGRWTPSAGLPARTRSAWPPPRSGIAGLFRATVSSEEVPRGKPAPDVYLEAARRLGVDASACVAIEDSHNGILSAKAAGMGCIAIPNERFPPGGAEDEADLVLPSIRELTVDAVRLFPG